MLTKKTGTDVVSGVFIVPIKGELHSNSWNLTFVNKLQFPLILRSFVFKASKTDNRSWDIYVFSDTETCFYTISE